MGLLYISVGATCALVVLFGIPPIRGRPGFLVRHVTAGLLEQTTAALLWFHQIPVRALVLLGRVRAPSRSMVHC